MGRKIDMALYSENANLWTVDAMLQDALLDEEKDYNKAILITLNDKDGAYDVVFSQAGMSMSDALALIEVGKTLILRQMGYLPEQE